MGCGKTESLGSGNEYNVELAIDQNNTKAEEPPIIEDKEDDMMEKKQMKNEAFGIGK